MNYISLDNLTRYHSKFKDYADAKYTLANDYGWKQTEKAGAVACWPVGESRMKPVVEFLFKETLPVGDKSSQNPSTITGVSNVKMTRCGKNFLIPPYYDDTYSDSDLTVTLLDDGSIKITKSVSTNNKYYNFIWETPVFRAGTTFIMSATQVSGTVNGNIAIQILSAETNSILKWQYLANANTAYTLENDTKLRFRFYLNYPSVCTDLILKPQIELGSAVTAYEKGEGTDYTINFPSTFYGGILDVATGKLTVTHRMIEADSLTLDISNYPAYLPLECTDTFGRTITSTGNILALTGSTGGKIVYKLANPYTVQIDPVAITSLPQIDKYTPRLNTLYTDAENITVKYIKSPIRDEYEKVQAIIANGGTI